MIEQSFPCISQTLDEVKQSFEIWRATRPHKTRIPEQLWDAAVSLTTCYPPSRVALALRLNYTDLKDRMPQQEEVGSIPPFLELGLPDDFVPVKKPSPRAVFELESHNGNRVRCTIDGSLPDNLLGVIQTFLDQG